MTDRPALGRRELIRSAVAVGGAVGLAACLDAIGEDAPEGAPPAGVADPSRLPERQHAWDDRIRHDDAGNAELPRHQSLWYLELQDRPDADARASLETALETLDRALERSHDGLLYSLAYSPEYFDRYFAEPLPEGLDLPPARRLSTFESPEIDRQDALLHLATDRPTLLLEVEAALRGELDRLNGVTVETALTDVFDLETRRTGFVGAGMPAAEASEVQGVAAGTTIPDASPLFMGFKAGFARNQATESYVTLDRGPFAGGTTKHVSNIRQRLDDWYGEQSYEERVMEMFSPGHAEAGLLEGAGDGLGDDSKIDRFVDDIEADASEYGRVGHAQKAARANRDADGNVVLLRRHFESSDEGQASLHFPSLQRGISQFEAVRQAMNGQDLTQVSPAVRQRVNNGILEYIFTKHRGNFLVVPRSLRALPTPTGGPT